MLLSRDACSFSCSVIQRHQFPSENARARFSCKQGRIVAERVELHQQILDGIVAFPNVNSCFSCTEHAEPEVSLSRSSPLPLDFHDRLTHFCAQDSLPHTPSRRDFRSRSQSPSSRIPPWSSLSQKRVSPTSMSFRVDAARREALVGMEQVSAQLADKEQVAAIPHARTRNPETPRNRQTPRQTKRPDRDRDRKSEREIFLPFYQVVQTNRPVEPLWTASDGANRAVAARARLQRDAAQDAGGVAEGDGRAPGAAPSCPRLQAGGTLPPPALSLSPPYPLTPLHLSPPSYMSSSPLLSSPWSHLPSRRR